MKISSILCIAVGVVLAASVAVAEPALESGTNAVVVLPIPRPSSFERDKVPRDPFQPIDAGTLAKTGPIVVTAAEAPTSEADFGKAIRVSAISRGEFQLVVVNNAILAKGESFVIAYSGTSMRVKVSDIGSEAVDFESSLGKARVPIRVIRPKSLENVEASPTPGGKLR